MKNPFKPERSAQDHDNPVVPNVVERPVERAADSGCHARQPARAECDRATGRASHGRRPRRGGRPSWYRRSPWYQ